jgi:beta-N-acetylhexosaminidase
MRIKTWFPFLLFVGLLLGLAFPAQAQQPDDPAARLLARMPPAARVGQLFLVTFPGTATDETSALYDLIVEDRIGGVLLRPGNGNTAPDGNSPARIAALTGGLQQLAWEASRIPLPAPAEGDAEAAQSPYVPLFVAVEQGPDGEFITAVISGTTPLPSPMAIGATWNLDYAETVGTIVGQELSAVGVNLVLGPSLDVLDTPRPRSPADLGVRSFGGDPYWVGRMGAAYIRGIHTGSGGRIAAVAGRFPGLGAADRPLSEEVSIVQKSLEQLKQIELAPFFAVTGAEDPLSQPDGLLVSHIRYRGFQGNIYASTKPVSFDPQALQQLMALPVLASWREAGGVTVADELGARAVRRSYDPTEQQFNGVRIAREAFLAGNDLLVLSHFAMTDDWESHIANIRDVVTFFQEKYASDPTFQARVDEAVLRILRLKLRLYNSYGTVTFGEAQVDQEVAAESVGQHREQVAPIAQDAVTLLSPPSPDLRPVPPAADERIVIFSDDRQVSPCAGCAPVYVIAPTLLEETLVRLYGPAATRQVDPNGVTSFTFSELVEYLDTPPAVSSEEATPVPPHRAEVALQGADWILFAMLDVTEQVPQSNAVRRFLAEKADLLRNKKLVVFAFSAPYYLDTTEIAKLSSYLGLYSYTEPFVEVGARALFDEFPLTGASPVSVAGLNYNLITQTQPDPDQIIELLIGGQDAEESEQPLEIHQGDTLLLRTSVILDRNGRQVPDGTPVEFTLAYPQEGLEHPLQVTTRSGVAETTVTLDRVGQLQVSVRAEPVPRAVRLQMDIREGQPAIVIAITPTPSPTARPIPTPTPAVTPEVVPGPAQEPGTAAGGPEGRVGWLDLAQGLAGAALMALASYVGVWRLGRDPFRALRGALWCAACGLVAYIGLALGLPGIDWAQRLVGTWTSAALTVAGGVIPLAVVLLGEVVRRGSAVTDQPPMRSTSGSGQQSKENGNQQESPHQRQ